MECSWAGLNCRPLAHKANALTTELHEHFVAIFLLRHICSLCFCCKNIICWFSRYIVSFMNSSFDKLCCYCCYQSLSLQTGLFNNSMLTRFFLTFICAVPSLVFSFTLYTINLSLSPFSPYIYYFHNLITDNSFVS